MILKNIRNMDGKPILRTQLTAKNLFLYTRRTQCTAPTILTDFFNKHLVNIRGRARSIRGLWSGRTKMFNFFKVFDVLAKHFGKSTEIVLEH